MYAYISMSMYLHIYLHIHMYLHIELENLKSFYNLQFSIYVENSMVSLLKSWEPGVL